MAIRIRCTDCGQVHPAGQCSGRKPAPPAIQPTRDDEPKGKALHCPHCGKQLKGFRKSADPDKQRAYMRTYMRDKRAKAKTLASTDKT